MDNSVQQESLTSLASIGKFALIERLTSDFHNGQETTVQGVGDDCAVIRQDGKGRHTLIAVHTMAEGIDFDMMYTPLKHLGYKAAAIALSNIAAMNGTPRALLMSIALSSRYSVEALEEFYAGIRHCCQRYHVDLVGGDTTTTPVGLTLTATAVGDVDPKETTYRSGARLHDLICVSGDLGSAYSGLLVLEREKATYKANPNFQPQLEGYDYVLERYLKPEPRYDILKILHEKEIVPTAMIDVSDGLASELLHLCKASKCGCEIYEERIPIDFQTSRVCSEMSQNMLPISNALNGGSDYELLFTVRPDDYEKIRDVEAVSIIGHITDGTPIMVTPQNTAITLRAQGWQGNED